MRISAVVRAWLPAATLCGALCAQEAAVRDGPPVGTELFTNARFERKAEGWTLKHAHVAADVGPDGGPAVVLEAAGAGDWANVGRRLADPPARRVLEFTAQVWTEAEDQAVLLNVFALGPDDASGEPTELDSWSTPFGLVAGEWRSIQTTLVVPDDTRQLTLWVISEGDVPKRVALPSLLVQGAGAPALKHLDGPGVIRATAGVAVAPHSPGATGQVTFPIPLLQDRQVPLSFALTCEPADALEGFHWESRPDGQNWLCVVDVSPPPTGAAVSWEALVLVGDAATSQLPVAHKPEAPPEAAAWLRSTRCVQSDDPDVAAKARELARGTSEVEGYVRRVVDFTSTNQGEPGAPFVTLDAAAALHCGGSCTSRANLCAALLRAHGIPARTSAHLPTWSGPLYEHWHTEYWHPGAGWVRVEPTLGQMRPQPWTMAVINVANPEDEDRAFEPSMAHSHVMSGAPDLAVHRISDELEIAEVGGAFSDGQVGPGNQATCVSRLAGSDEEIAAVFEAARLEFAAAAQACGAGRPHPRAPEGLRAALASGRAADLTAWLRSGSIADERTGQR